LAAGILAAVVRDLLGTLARVGLAAVWLVSGGLKAADPEQTYLAVQAFDVLPAGAVGVVAAALPFVEIALGVLLLAGLGTRLVAAASLLLLAAFIAGVAQAWARGLSIDCGCFGGGGAVSPGETRYPQEIARDVGFAVLAAWLVVRPRTLLALDLRSSRGGTAVALNPEGGR
jgi:uncharacterized membrane protein YphA (DoxX/SURF4 family)